MKKAILILILTSAVLMVNAQKQANYWYFGDHAGLSFSMGPPSALTNGVLDTGEGCSSISTSAGSLEFYTDGRFVYNRNHQQMPNGSGLYGHSSSTQSGIIVPKPGSTTEYYIFTVDAADNGLANGLCYSKVDMSLADGLGDVVTTEKNISLVPLACEKVTAVGHSDGQTYWVITKKWGNNEIYAYRITYDGVVTTPVVSATGPPITGNIGQASKGYLKVSPDGTKIAAANNTDFSVVIYNFDNSTGVVTHLVTDATYVSPGGYDPGGPYGVEFAPNSKRLYIGEWKANRRIQQYDLTSGDPATILSSRVVVASVGQSSDPIGALQLGPDNRLYIARMGSGYLSRINQPNNLGAACEFVENAVNLAGKESTYGLPPFIQSFFYLTVDFYWDDPACDGYYTQFYASASDTPDSLQWTFPDGSHSTEMNPTYMFPGIGLYNVTLKIWIYGQSKTVMRFVQVRSNPDITLINDTTICASEAFYIDPGEYSSYLWQNGSTDPTILTDTTGWYWCEIANEWGCTAIDSTYIIVNPNPDVNAGSDFSINEGESTTLQGEVTGGSGNYSYMWQPAALLLNPNILQPVTIVMNTTTTFTLTVTDLNTGCIGISDVLVTVIGGVLACNVSADPSTVCSGEQTQLHALAYGGTGTFTYSWTSNPPGFTSNIPNPVVVPGQTTTYILTVEDGENLVTDDIVVYVNPLPVPNAGADQSITYSTTTVLQGSASQGIGPYAYHWEPADKLVSANMQNPTTVNLYEATVYSLEVTDLTTGCVSGQPDLVMVSLEGNALTVNPSAMPDAVCAGETVQLISLASGGTNNYTYSWTSNPPGFTSNQEQPTATPLINTVYTVVVNDGVNSKTGTVAVTVNQLPLISLLPANDPKIQIISPTEIGVCVFDSVTIDAGNPGSSYLWSNGSIDQTITIQTSGISFDLQEYDVEVTNQLTGCSNTSTITAYFTFTNCSYGIEENKSENSLQVYPNPSTDGIFNYLILGLKGEVMIEVYTAHGDLIFSEALFLNAGATYKSTLNLGNIGKGVFYLRLTNAETVILKKLIMQ